METNKRKNTNTTNLDGRSKIMEYIRCQRCNRPLKNKKSRERGLGYVCYKKIKKEQEQREFEKIQLTIYEFLEREV